LNFLTMYFSNTSRTMTSANPSTTIPKKIDSAKSGTAD
jgi:hypothetical protein